jgi:hypothetical protein
MWGFQLQHYGHLRIEDFYCGPDLCSIEDQECPRLKPTRCVSTRPSTFPLVPTKSVSLHTLRIVLWESKSLLLVENPCSKEWLMCQSVPTSAYGFFCLLPEKVSRWPCSALEESGPWLGCAALMERSSLRLGSCGQSFIALQMSRFIVYLGRISILQSSLPLNCFSS